jgi:hypothetical protein
MKIFNRRSEVLRAAVMNNSLLGHNAGLGGVISKKNKLYKKLKFK